MKIFDTHIHLNSDFLKEKYHNLISAHKNFFYNNIGTTLQDSELAIKQSSKYKNVFCTIGIHPLEIKNHLNDEQKVFIEFEKYLKSNSKIIGIGETGLDFYREDKYETFDLQKNWLIKHLQLAKKYNLPLILHIRHANAEMINLLKNEIDWFGIIHCFDGTLKDLQEYLKLETWMISISPILIRDLKRFKSIITATPLNYLLIESDAPWLTKTPWTINQIIFFIAETKGKTPEEVAQQLIKNSNKVFNLNL